MAWIRACLSLISFCVCLDNVFAAIRSQDGAPPQQRTFVDREQRSIATGAVTLAMLA